MRTYEELLEAHNNYYDSIKPKEPRKEDCFEASSYEYAMLMYYENLVEWYKNKMIFAPIKTISQEKPKDYD